MSFIIIIGLIVFYLSFLFIIYNIESKIDNLEKILLDFKYTFLNCYKHLSDDNTIINDNVTSLMVTMNRQNDEYITTY